MPFTNHPAFPKSGLARLINHNAQWTQIIIITPSTKVKSPTSQSEYAGFKSHLWGSRIPAINFYMGIFTKPVEEFTKKGYRPPLILVSFIYGDLYIDRLYTYVDENIQKPPRQLPLHRLANICHLVVHLVYGSVTAPSTIWTPYSVWTDSAQWQQLWAIIADNKILESLEV